jgi:adenylate cyclase
VSFRNKIFLGSTLAVLALALTTGIGAAILGRAHLRGTIVADFQRAPELLRERLGRTYRSFDAQVGAWAEDKRYAAWLGRASDNDAPGHEATTDDLNAARVGLGAIVYSQWREFRVLNDTGRLLLDAQHQDDPEGRRKLFQRVQEPAVARALSGEEVLRLRGRLLEMARAVRVEGAIRGVLVAADPVEPIRDDLQKILRSRVTLLEGGAGDAVVHTVKRDGETWLETTVSIPGLAPGEVIGQARLERSLSAELAPLEGALLSAVGIGTAAGLAVAVALSLLLARALGAPVARLGAATREIARGNYDYRVAVASRDELGLLAQAFNEMAAGLRQRVFFESALRRYLAAPVVEQLIRDPARLRLGGEKREVTVLFFDVAGFTGLAEALAADELVALVNAYLDALVEAIFRHDGTLDKFIGDAVMAFWGAPIDQRDHAARAARAACDMQVALARFAGAHPDPRVRALRGRIGLHTGVAALGNLGSTHIMSYTAMGDTVNVASRLEGVNKLYGTALLASAATVEASGWTACREIDRVRVKGRGEPLTIFELFGTDAAGAPPPAALDAYAEGLRAYRARRFEAAEQAFRRARRAGDGACAEIMADRAAALATSPPPPDWDGAHNLAVK